MSHDDLVSSLVWFIKDKWQGTVKAMLVDHGVLDTATRPPMIEGHIPDVYARIKNDRCIVGEAKTPKDFETERSQKQIISLLKYVSDHSCLFFMSVPFFYHRAASGRIESLARAKKLNVDGYVVHEFGFRRLRCK